MIRTVIGGLVAGIILFVIGFIFWATPLAKLAYSKADEAQNAAVQASLAQNLTRKDTATGDIAGTGTYIIPDPSSPGGNQLYSRGPIATVHYNTGNYSPSDMSHFLPGFIVALLSGLLIAFGLAAAGGRSFADLARLVVCFSLGFTVWEYLGSPIFNHYGWGFWIYTFIAESVALIVAGLVVARWFVPHRERVQPAVAPEAGQPSPADRHPGESRDVDSHSKCNSWLDTASAGVWKSRHFRGVWLYARSSWLISLLVRVSRLVVLGR